MNKFNLGKVRGEDGKSATIAIGTVRTGQAGSDARVENVGDSLRAIFDFTIPRGDKGNEAYSPGSNVQINDGVISATDTTYTAGDNIDITNEVITYVPTSPIMQPNRIDQNVTVPDGYNAVMFGDFEIAPGVTIECVGNANFIALG